MIFVVLAACTPEEPTPPPPVEATPPEPLPWVDTGIYRPPDTGNIVLTDDVPENLISVEHRGTWNRSGTPYDTIVGTLTVREIVDGYIPETADTADVLPCDVSWYVTATPSPVAQTCTGCNQAWAVTFTYDVATPSTIETCNDTELPGDGDVWRMALNPAEGIIYFDYFYTGVWMPWWEAEEFGNLVEYGWTGEFAITVEEEDMN